MNIKFYIAINFFIAASFNAFNANAQNNYFKISGQYRVRPELRHGYKTLAADSSKTAFFIAQRARLIFEYKKDNITTYASVQDIRTWGDEEQLKDIPGLSVNELWLELGFKKHFSLKMGRQELVYDDQRLLGNLDWVNATRSHDALLLKYINKDKKLSWHLGGAFNQSGEPLFGTAYSLKNYKFLGFTWLKKEFAESGCSISAIAVVNGLNSTILSSLKPKASLTFGPLLNYQHTIFKGILGAYYQTGKTENNLSLNAFMINSSASFNLKKIITVFGLDYLSGNSNHTPSNESHNFSTLYATNHKFYGYMDYFINFPADTKQRGLIDPYLRLGYIVNKNLTATLDTHLFLSANKFNSATNKSLGKEFDALVEYKPSAIMNLQIGYSMMFATKNMESIKGGNKSNYNGWVFVMIKVSPTFFTHEFKN